MTDLAFPSVTICSPGLNMEAVKEAILDDFDKWLNKTGGNYKEQLDDFMEEKYAKKVGEGNIFEQIKAMNSPPPPEEQGCKSCSAGLQNLAACRKTGASTRKKRSIEGKFSLWSSCIMQPYYFLLLAHYQRGLRTGILKN